MLVQATINRERASFFEFHAFASAIGGKYHTAPAIGYSLMHALLCALKRPYHSPVCPIVSRVVCGSPLPRQCGSVATLHSKKNTSRSWVRLGPDTVVDGFVNCFAPPVLTLSSSGTNECPSDVCQFFSRACAFLERHSIRSA